MIPALFIRMSSRELLARNCFAAEWTELRDARSICTTVRVALGTRATISAIATSPRSLLRDPMKICAGLCFASWRAASFPRPAFPVHHCLVSSQVTGAECA